MGLCSPASLSTWFPSLQLPSRARPTTPRQALVQNWAVWIQRQGACVQLEVSRATNAISWALEVPGCRENIRGGEFLVWQRACVFLALVGRAAQASLQLSHSLILLLHVCNLALFVCSSEWSITYSLGAVSLHSAASTESLACWLRG